MIGVVLKLKVENEEHERVSGQERAKELTAHEEQLEEWKKRFKAEALRQIGERERALSEWQAQLDAKRADLEDLKRNMEVRPGLHGM